MGAEYSCFDDRFCPGDTKDQPNEGQTQTETKTDSKNNSKLRQSYFVGRQLGAPGATGIAYLVTHKISGEKRAVKAVALDKMSAAGIQQMKEEAVMTRSFNHKNVIQAYESFEDSTNATLYLVMELCEGGELFDRIVANARMNKHYSERIAAFYVKQMLEGLCYLHDKKIVHRDLKPENFLFLDDSEDSPLKIIDFGFSKFLETGEDLTTYQGTQQYMAPEVQLLRRGGRGTPRWHVGAPSDVWSVGCTMFAVLFGRIPFAKHDPTVTYFKNVVGSKTGPWFPKRVPVTTACRDLLTCMLRMDPNDRISARDALVHPWFVDTPDTPIPQTVMDDLSGLTHSSAEGRNEFLQMLIRTMSLEELEAIRESWVYDINTDHEVNADPDLKLAGANQHQQNIMRFISLGDTDGDGKLDKDELMMLAIQSKLVSSESMLKEWFESLCGDDDYVTAEDLKDMLQQRNEKLRADGKQAQMLPVEGLSELIEKCDTDHDGNLSWTEFVTIFVDARSARHQALSRQTIRSRTERKRAPSLVFPRVVTRATSGSSSTGAAITTTAAATTGAAVTTAADTAGSSK